MGIFSLIDINTDNINISPFNIKDALPISMFTKEEAIDLFDQFQKEFKIKVEESIITEIFEYTNGYFSF
jgi:hypothetical protein